MNAMNSQRNPEQPVGATTSTRLGKQHVNVPRANSRISSKVAGDKSARNHGANAKVTGAKVTSAKVASVKTQVTSAKLTSSKAKVSSAKDTTFTTKVATRKVEVIERLPDEVLLTLFDYLDASDLLIASRVCKRWLIISNDNMLWRKMYEKYLAKTKTGKNIGIPLVAPTLFWKKQCLQKSIELRNTKVKLKLNKVDPFTTLPSNIGPNLKQLGVKFTLAFVDGRGTHHYIRHDDCFYHRMSVTARWYNMETLPSVLRLETLKLLALNPVFYDHKGEACKNSPHQRSLLLQFPWDWAKVTSSPLVGSDSTINIYSIHQGIILAVFKDGGGIAFIAANFHFHQLIERCINGTFERSYDDSQLAPTRDMIDPHYGLHGFSATVELRNARQSIWSQQFRSIDRDSSSSLGELCHLLAIHSDKKFQHSPLERSIEFRWKSSIFKNTTLNLCILDISVRDEHGRLVWCVSDFVQSLPSDSAGSYDYDSQRHIICYKSNQGEIMLIVDQDSTTSQQIISSLRISPKLIS